MSGNPERRLDWRLLAGLAAALSLLPAGVAAQSGAGEPAPSDTVAARSQGPDSTPARQVRRVVPRSSSPVLPAGHWGFDAVRRLNALDLLDGGTDPGAASLTCDELGAELGAAAENARARRPDLGPLVDAYRAALTEETDICPDSGRHWGGSLGAGWGRATALVGAGTGYMADDWTGTRPLADTSTAFLGARAVALLGRAISLVAEPQIRQGGPRLVEAQATLGLGPLAFWAGRRRFQFGPAVGGGIVLGDAVAFNGAGWYFARPFRFPWIFRAMGPIRMESFVSQVRGGDRIRNPYFIAFRGSMMPHPRLVVGLNRAAMFGGRGNDPITLRRLAFLAVGGTQVGTAGAFANDVLSVDVHYRPPLGRLPLATYIEWGMDDAAGAWHHEPGYTAGLGLGALPGLPWVAAGAEWTSFAHHYPQNSIWYRNFALRNGWTSDGTAVGNPLGGNGRQALGYLVATAPGGWLDARLTGFYRRRGDENLFAPERMGVSRGGSVRLRLRPLHRAGAFVDGDYEVGSGWTQSRWSTGIQVRLGPAAPVSTP